MGPRPPSPSGGPVFSLEVPKPEVSQLTQIAPRPGPSSPSGGPIFSLEAPKPEVSRPTKTVRRASKEYVRPISESLGRLGKDFEKSWKLR